MPWVGEIAASLQCLLKKHEFNPPHKKAYTMVYNCNWPWGGRNRSLSELYYPASVVKSVSYGSSEKPCFKKIRWREIEENSQCWPLLLPHNNTQETHILNSSGQKSFLPFSTVFSGSMDTCLPTLACLGESFMHLKSVFRILLCWQCPSGPRKKISAPSAVDEASRQKQLFEACETS